jgi:gamma-glutamylcyclotransferase (GGCT)/AIG2-like uncharacterized protein YtfP
LRSLAHGLERVLMNADCRLATYGTLSPGRSNHHQLSGLRGQWSGGSVRGDLHDAGWGAAQGYPGLVLNPTGETVAVDLFSSDDLPDHWARLDAFEGDGYRRVVAEVTTPHGAVAACIYVLVAPA